MQVNKFVVIGAIALASIGVIASLNNVKYQEEKKAARSEAEAAEVSCNSLSYHLEDISFWENEAKKKSDNTKETGYLKQAQESADKSKKACEKIKEYKNKYEG